MPIPTIFIVGAPRCGTTSLQGYLAAHPRVFMCDPKEPHHFGPDLLVRWNPHAKREAYLQLFNRARDDQQAGEASPLYLYSKTAPHEIKAFSPSAKIIILLRDPVQMVQSLHEHSLFLLNEDLVDLEQALAAESDRRLGRRIPSYCNAPLVLQYTTLARYSEHVERYQEVFGRERVRCILFEDLKNDPERVYRETLAFLGLEPAGSPNFKAHNPGRRWRSQRLARLTLAPYFLGLHLCFRLPPGRARTAALTLLGLLFHLPLKANSDQAPRLSALPFELRSALRERFRDDIERLAGILGRDLSSWLQPE